MRNLKQYPIDGQEAIDALKRFAQLREAQEIQLGSYDGYVLGITIQYLTQHPEVLQGIVDAMRIT